MRGGAVTCAASGSRCALGPFSTLDPNGNGSFRKAASNYNWETPWSTLVTVGGILVAAKRTQTTRVYTRSL